MKKIVTMLLVTGLLLACNSGNDNKGNTDSISTEENHQDHEKKSEGLILNNGAKWKADSTTLLNVALLENIVSAAKKESLENYIQTATQLQDGLNKMITECKMKGADHDALHQWLEPLMEKTRDLKKATSTENAAAIMSEIDKHLNLFAQYFE